MLFCNMCFFYKAVQQHFHDKEIRFPGNLFLKYMKNKFEISDNVVIKEWNLVNTFIISYQLMFFIVKSYWPRFKAVVDICHR